MRSATWIGFSALGLLLGLTGSTVGLDLGSNMIAPNGSPGEDKFYLLQIHQDSRTWILRESMIYLVKKGSWRRMLLHICIARSKT